jgi:hypothetical protein
MADLNSNASTQIMRLKLEEMKRICNSPVRPHSRVSSDHSSIFIQSKHLKIKEPRLFNSNFEQFPKRNFSFKNKFVSQTSPKQAVRFFKVKNNPNKFLIDASSNISFYQVFSMAIDKLTSQIISDSSKAKDRPFLSKRLVLRPKWSDLKFHPKQISKRAMSTQT